MFDKRILHSIALETLKHKCDLKSSKESEILNCYFNIYKELKTTNATLPKAKIDQDITKSTKSTK